MIQAPPRCASFVMRKTGERQWCRVRCCLSHGHEGHHRYYALTNWLTWTDEDARLSIQLWKKARVKKVARPVEAWRAWRISRGRDNDIFLMSMVADFWWEGPVTKVDPPISWEWDDDIHTRNSGIHAFRSLEILRAEYNCPEVVGTVSLSGKVMVHQFGYRAEKALITKLWIPSFHRYLSSIDIERLEERYQCDVVSVGGREDWRNFWEEVQNGPGG